MKANSEKTKQSKKATRRVLAGVLCGASVLSLVLSLVMPPISQAIANGTQEVAAEEVAADEGTLSKDARADNPTGKDAENRNSDDAEGGEGEDATVADLSADDTGAESAAQPANDGQSVYKVATVANEGVDQKLQQDSDGYTLLNNDRDLSTYLALAPANRPPRLRLTADISSSESITISQNTTIDLANHKLYYSNGNDNQGQDQPVRAFITIQKGNTLTVKGEADDSKTETTSGEPGQPAEMQFTDESVPQSLTYYVTESTPDGFGTSENTYLHTVTNFGAIVACKNGYVNRVISVAEGGTLKLDGGMITTPRILGNNGHVIFSQGTVDISGGYVTNGNGGGWGGGLCMAAGSLNMTGGVIAANKAASGGGIFADSGVTLDLSGGVISGNATYAVSVGKGDTADTGGYGGGVYTKGATVTISGSANITNNRVEAQVTNQDIYNNGLLGGGGIASTSSDNKKGSLTMTGGSVTANYSHEAGGGIYAGFWNQAITFKMTGGTIAGNVAENAEGGGLRISTGTHATIDADADGKIYITNNKTMTGSNSGEGRKGDWGGGGIFIQKNGRLNILKSLITDNKAGGWSGGIGACPTGETIVSHSDGAAIYNNTDNVGQDGTPLNEPHYSAGGDGKKQDQLPAYITDNFKKFGHKDFFLVRDMQGADKTIAVVLGKMLGGGSAGWHGTCDNNEIKIDANGGAEAKYMFGLEAHPSDQAIKDAKEAATTIISGNYSYTHGGGIMTNGDLIVGEVTSLDVYPAIKVKANKVLMKDGKPQGLTGHGYKFKLLGKAADSAGEPYWNTDGSLNANGCEATSEVTVNESGEIVIDTAANYQSGNYDLYLVEVPISEEGTTFDKAIYKIHIKVGTTPVNTTSLLGIKINRYGVDRSASTVSVKKEGAADFTACGSDFYGWSEDANDKTVSTVKIGNASKPAFTNELAPYQTSGSWTPRVTKKVDGGEMKRFKFELYAENSDNTETPPQTKYTSAESGNSQTVTFDPVPIGPLGINDLTNGKATFTYYIRECDASEADGTKHEGYKNDTKKFKVVVTATDKGDGTLECTPTYYEVDANDVERETDNPTFTNTYSTSLPLSGMSGVTLTYLAGAAVLCAAAAWMHIRRKANAKGGKRRE
ncbi:Spy0128 family protein [Collinsella aerofaciens]|uniref:Spy0128 family protein n=1 Tax=Collinsella aerofaciens TaxID=74426 RepID=UPI0034A3DCA4